MTLVLVAAVLLLCLQNGIANSFSRFLLPLDDSVNVLSATASNQCLSDVSLFTGSLQTYVTTLRQCQQNGQCTEQQQRILQENLYAAKQFDAFGKIPPGVLEVTLINPGSYRECMKLDAPYKVHYCYARGVWNNQAGNPVAELGVRVGVCMPRSCSEKDIPKLLGTVEAGGVITVNFVDSSCVPTNVTPTTGFWIFMSLMGFFVIWAIASTVVDYILDVYYVEKKEIKNKAMDAFLAFSLYSNGSLLLNVNPPKEGNIKSLASIRFLSMTWVASGHTLLENSFSESLLPVLTMWDPLLSTTILNAFLSVDTFFLLSGVLVSYLFFKARPSLRYVKNPINWIMFYVHRYLRLTPSMMFFIGFYTVVLPFVNGPYTAALTEYVGSIETRVEACEKNWWRNMLYINNFYVRGGTTKACYNILWYLALDTQFYFIAPIFLIAFYFYPLIGGALILLCSGVSIWYVYAVTSRYDLPATIIGVFTLFTGKIDEFFSEYYEIPWARWNPYLIGIIVGYLLAKLNERRPKLNWLVVISSWLAATAVALLSLYGPHDYMKGDNNWNKMVRGTYNNFSRIGWSLAVSWVIVANHLGWGGNF
ncbi:hypothetical protein RB195_007855 [Necator americanus]|uniref:Nose resistant-to-fluoxetine protein N-terminal domain-containing protein n=1 Tax=Necator americanus TaxID=51031 RepID=A0ABR1C1V5_NECAM